MIAFQFSTISIILIVVSFLHIDASIHRYIRQVTATQCQYPNIVMCDYVQCTNGRCVEDKNSVDCYKCQCAPGFTGKLCDSPIVTPSACNPSCRNGGECSQTATNTFICICPPEYTGNQCETSVLDNHPCITIPTIVCQNGGTCNINGADYLCSCAIGWTGRNCQTPQNSCPVDYCLSGGTCQMNGSAPYCNCPATHFGQRCEILIGGLTTTTTTTTTTTSTTSAGTPPSISCATNPCLNGGSCYATGNSALCLCKQGWSGQSAPYCNCPATHFGQRCEILIGGLTTTTTTTTTTTSTTSAG
ncbi:unnamed protein product, partial [Rotaria socialis]